MVSKSLKDVFIITSGLDVITNNFMLSFIKLSKNVFSGDISVIMSGINLSQDFDDNVVDYKIISSSPDSSEIMRIIRYLSTQLKILKLIIQKKDYYIFFLAQSLILPILVLKLMGRKVILIVGASEKKLIESKKERFRHIIVFKEAIGFKLADVIILYSENIMNEWNLSKYKNKISIAHRHFIDFEKFTIKENYFDRDNIIGYIGRFSEEKGILNFIKAIPLILEEKNDYKFLLIGNGNLKEEIVHYLYENNLEKKVIIVENVPHNEIPDYLNKLKLVVIPSYTEGLPNIMIESMACGTPVLATPVGSVPDFIEDNENGFLMENNKSQTIAKNVFRIVESHNILKIIENAFSKMKSEFSFDNVADNYYQIFKKL